MDRKSIRAKVFEETSMDVYYYLYLGALILALAAAFYISKSKSRPKAGKAQIPNICIGAIRVTREGRNMLIIRKDDGSFEMVEEEHARKQCTIDSPPSGVA
jgi:hypothetical protein